MQDQKREEKVSKRVNAIQEVNESVALLTQLLQEYDGAAANQSNAELLQVRAEPGGLSSVERGKERGTTQ